MGTIYGYASDDHEYKMPPTPSSDSLKGRGEWAEDKEERLRDALLPRVDPCGEDVWPLERDSRERVAETDGRSGTVEAHYMSEDKPVDSHMLRDAMADMQDDAARIINEAVERQVKQLMPLTEAKAGLPHNPLHDHMHETFKRCLDISVAKNADYSDGASDPLSNFRLSEQFGVSMPQGIMVRLSDKFSRISHLLDGRDPAVEDERLSDTIRDAINYMAILAYALEASNER